MMRMRMAKRAEFMRHMKLAKCAKKMAVWCTIFKLILAMMLSCSTCKFMKALKAKDEVETTVSVNHHYTYVQQAPQQQVQAAPQPAPQRIFVRSADVVNRVGNYQPPQIQVI